MQLSPSFRFQIYSTIIEQLSRAEIKSYTVSKEMIMMISAGEGEWRPGGLERGLSLWGRDAAFSSLGRMPRPRPNASPRLSPENHRPTKGRELHFTLLINHLYHLTFN